MKSDNRELHKSADLPANDFDRLIDQFPPSLRRHSHRVGICCYTMARYAKGSMWFDHLPAGIDIEAAAHWGGILHDVGKLLLPNFRISKESYMQHPALGTDFLEKHKDELFENEVHAQIVMEMVHYHHVRPDGKGFPKDPKAKAVPFAAGICAVADSIDHRLCAKSGPHMNGADVLEKLKRQAGTVFPESAVICAEKVWPQIMRHYANWNRDMRLKPQTRIFDGKE